MFDDWEHSLLVFKKVYGLCFNMWIACYLILRSFMRWTTVMTYNDASKGDWNYHWSNLCTCSHSHFINYRYVGDVSASPSLIPTRPRVGKW